MFTDLDLQLFLDEFDSNRDQDIPPALLEEEDLPEEEEEVTSSSTEEGCCERRASSRKRLRPSRFMDCSGTRRSSVCSKTNRFSKAQRAWLEDAFHDFCKHPGLWRSTNVCRSPRMDVLCGRTGLSVRQITKWLYAREKRGRNMQGQTGISSTAVGDANDSTVQAAARKGKALTRACRQATSSSSKRGSAGGRGSRYVSCT